MSSLPTPRYSFVQAMATSLALAMQALKEVRALARLPGEKGEPGKDGEPGGAGLTGKDGSPGAVGPKGQDGRNGSDGAPGRNGLDAENVQIDVGEDFPAEIDAKDLRNLRVRDVTINGVTFQALCRS